MSQAMKKVVADHSVMIGGKHHYPGAVLELDSKQVKHLEKNGVGFSKPSKRALEIGHEPKDEETEDSPAEA